jgi:3',5'-cyclic AMP phosphodiesterase CpdA
LLRIAHISDLHVLAPSGVEWRRVIFNKRMTGYANLVLRRGRVYRRELLLSVLAAATAQADHLVVTGDITNLSLEGEYAEARRLLADVTRSVEVTVVPGNHDIYLPAVYRERRFPHYFRPFMESDLPELALDLQAGRFPFVKLRGPAAIIGLSSAVPRPPFVSAGYVGPAQLEALARVFAHPEVARRTPVVVIHHGPIDSWVWLEQLRTGLIDASAVRRYLKPLGRGLVLYGHLHLRSRHRLSTPSGQLEVVCASGAALDHPHDGVRAGYNLYEIADDGRIISIQSQVIAAAAPHFERVELALSGETS